MAVSVKVGKKHRITIPSEVRKQLGIKSGDELLVELRGGCVVLLPEPRDYSSTQGQEVGDSTSDETIQKPQHIMDFQLNDLRKASVLATANFLVAIGCMHTIEFLGGVRTGKLGVEGQVGDRFKAGVRLLQEVN